MERKRRGLVSEVFEARPYFWSIRSCIKERSYSTSSIRIRGLLTILITLALIFCFPIFLHAQMAKDLVVDSKKSQSPRLLYTFNVPGVWVIAIAFSPDGGMLAGSGAFGETLNLWDLKTGQEISVLEMKGDQARAIAFSPDGRMIALGGGRPESKGMIILLDARTLKVIRTLEGHSGFISSLEFSPDGKMLVSGSTDVRVWEVGTGRAIHSFKEGIGRVVPVAVSPDGRTFAHGSHSKGEPEPTTITIRDLQSGRVLQTLKGHTGYVQSITFSPDGRRLASGSLDRTIRIWDLKIGKQLLSLEGSSGNAQPIVFTPDGRMLASVREDSTVRLWDVESGQALDKFLAHKGYFISSLAISPEGRIISTGSTDHTVKVWELGTPTVVVSKPPPVSVPEKSRLEISAKPTPQVTIQDVFLAADDKANTRLSQPQRGQKVKMMMRYMISGISVGSRVEGIEYRRISYKGEQLVETKDQRQLEAGTYETFRTLKLPGDTPSGDYLLEGVILIGDKEIKKSFSFRLP